MFISVDTGLIYVAEAYGTPTIDIIGPMDENEQPPRGEFNKIVVAHRTAPQTHILDAYPSDPEECKRQVRDISADMVSNTFDKLYNAITHEGG